MKHSAPLPAHNLAPATLLHLEPLGARADWQPAHRHTFFEILVLEEAAGDQQLDSQTFTLVDNRLYFIGAGQVHTLRATHLRGWLLAFDPALLDQDGIGTEQLSVATLFSRWRQQPFIDLTADTAPSLRRCCCCYARSTLGRNPARKPCGPTSRRCSSTPSGPTWPIPARPCPRRSRRTWSACTS